MNNRSRVCGLIAAISMLATSSAMAISYDANVTNNVIYGTGNGNGFWTTNTENNVEVGLRAKKRWAGEYGSNGDGTYNHDAGISSGTAAIWNFDFSINVNQDGSSLLKISDYHISLSVDIDPTQGVSWVTLDPMTFWADNEFGDNSTAQSGGVKDSESPLTQAELGDAWSLMQNSQNIGWLGLGYDVNIDATYDFKLSATQVTGAPGAETSMQVIVGKGGSPVPDAGTTAGLLGVALFGLFAIRRRIHQ